MKDYGIGSFNAFLLATIVYIGLLFFIFYKINEETKVFVKYTDIKDSFIDIEVGEYKAPTPQNLPEKTAEPKKEETQEPSQETTNKMVKTEEKTQKASDISSLFGNIKEFQTEKTSKVQSSAKSQKNASSPQKEQEGKQLNDNLMVNKDEKVGESAQKQQTGVYDKFKGALRRKFEENWTLYEKNGNFKAKIEFIIESNGIFKYTFVEQTYNAEFDEKVMDFLNNLQGKYIALPPDNKAYEGTAILSDEIVTMMEENQ